MPVMRTMTCCECHSRVSDSITLTTCLQRFRWHRATSLLWSDGEDRPRMRGSPGEGPFRRVRSLHPKTWLGERGPGPHSQAEECPVGCGESLLLVLLALPPLMHARATLVLRNAACHSWKRKRSSRRSWRSQNSRWCCPLGGMSHMHSSRDCLYAQPFCVGHASSSSA